MKLFIIDALGPFIDEQDTPPNWSQGAFARLYDFKDIRQYAPRIIERFETFAGRVAALGYTAVSIDDLAHLAILDIYPAELRATLLAYRDLYTKIFSIAHAHGLRVFVNSDIMYFNEEIREYTKGHDQGIIRFLREALRQVFETYEVDGIITRIGECDGVDVESLFKSELAIRTPEQARRYVQGLLPLFREYDRLWIFRTWTLGAYVIGDLIWNKRTFLKVFEGIRSQHLIISMKYGDADFFRFLELNPLFALPGHRFLIELQAKREYDGFGELPYYTGWDYEGYATTLRESKHLEGILVWCQTGGWKKSDRITFLANSSPWVELNTASTIRIFQGVSADQCVQDFFPGRGEGMIEFLRAYNDVSGRILYPDTVRTAYFKKVRIPPLIWMFWDAVTINPLMVAYFRYVLKDTFRVVCTDIDRVRRLGTVAGVSDIGFIADTLEILYYCRLALAGRLTLAQLNKEIRRYTAIYPDFLHFSVTRTLRNRRRLQFFFSLLLRNKNRYRLVDFLLFNRYFPLPLIRLYVSLNRRSLPKFVNAQGMSLKDLLR